MSSNTEASAQISAPTAPNLSPSTDSGSSDSDNLTSRSTPTFSGSAEAGTTVELFANGISLGSTTTDPSGQWTFSVPSTSPLADGSVAVTAIASKTIDPTPATVQRQEITPASPGRTHQEVRNAYAFAALKDNGSVVTWGNNTYGGDSSSVASQLESGVSKIFSTLYAFAALKDNGSVVSWGHAYGGNSGSVALQLQAGVKELSSTGFAFAALKNDGSVVTWGLHTNGGDSSAVASKLESDVDKIFSTFGAFAALKQDGSVATWGSPAFGSNSSSVASQLESGVSNIFSTSLAFAALKDNGSVITWGNADYGGNSSSLTNELSSGVKQIFSTGGAFAAIKDNGSVVTWGNADSGANSNTVSSLLQSNVESIFSTGSAFAALKQDGSVVTWGNPDNGGNSSSLTDKLSSGVKHIVSNSTAFAAIKDNGSVVTWGNPDNGGNSSSLTNKLSSGVKNIVSTDSAFAAIKDNGSVVTWGNPDNGGNSSSLIDKLSSGVEHIISTGSAFAAIKDNGSVVTWGNPDNGGNSKSVSSDLESGVFSFANPFTNDRLIPANSGSKITSDPSSALNITIDATAPTFTSGGSAAAINENSGSNQPIYTATATDTSPLNYSLKTNNNDDSGFFSIDSSTGAVTLTANPDYESKSSYAFTVVATDSAGNTSEQPVTLKVNDLDDTAPPAPSTPVLTPASDSGRSDTDNLTNNRTPSFTGTAEANSSIELFAGNTSLGSTKTDSSGNWSFTVPESAPLTDGSIAITASASNTTETGPKQATVQRDEIPPRSGGYSTRHENKNIFAFAFLKNDGSIITTGRSFAGGDSTAVRDKISADVRQIFSNAQAFAALKGDGSVVTWGDPNAGGNGSNNNTDLQSGVQRVFSTSTAFAALKEDGSVVTWGPHASGGDSSSVASQLQSGVSNIFSSSGAFAALKQDGSVVTWGNNTDGGDSSSVASELESGVKDIYPNNQAFAALKQDGSVVTWGRPERGGDSNSVSNQLNSGVAKIVSTGYAFAALKDDGSVVTWGDSEYGGNSKADSNTYTAHDFYTKESKLIDKSDVHEKLQSGVQEIFATNGAFAALKKDGSVVTWGDANRGGNQFWTAPPIGVASQLESGVEKIFSSLSGFAALKKDGSVVPWGSINNGMFFPTDEFNSGSGIKEIFFNARAFAALKNDGSIVTGGHSSSGGSLNNDTEALIGDANNSKFVEVIEVIGTELAFAALRKDGSIVTWGDPSWGGNTSLQSGVISFADPFNNDRLILANSGSKITSDPSSALNITIDATAPTFTSGGSAAAISENSGSNQLIYTATATDTSPITYSLKTNNNDDAPSFSIESTSGKVTLNANPDYESKSSYAFTVVATDSAGNTSEQPVTLKVNDLDDTAPPAPSTPVLTPASDSGRSDTDNLTNNRTPSFTGTAEANSSIELFAGNTSLGSTKTDSSGNWSFTVPESAPLTDGSFAITALATDSAGNTSLRSADLNITIDATAPTFTSGGSAAAINENSGSNQPIYTATATDTSPLNYSLKTNNNDDAPSFSIESTSGKVTLNANPDYESKSSYAFTVVATDSAGNTSEQPVTLKVNDLDDTAPPAPSTPVLTPASDSGRSDTDNLTNNRTPSFTGTAEANSSIELFAGNTSLGSTKTDSSGNWSFTVPESAPLTDGSFAITALATDSAGNTSLRSADLNITIDATAPTFTSGGSAAAINENSGSNQLIYTATATDTSPLNYSLKTNNNDDSGFFSIDSSTGAVTLTANPDYESKSSYAFTVVATDSAGNTSEQPVTLKVNDLDDTAPPAPSTPVLTPASDSGRSDTDNLTNNRTPSFTGTAEANSSIELFAGNTSLGSTKTDSSGNWSFTVPESAPLTDGSFAITALATDSAGNTSLRSADLNITIDATAPTFTSGGSAAAINENSGSNQLIYTATATDTSPLNYSLKTNNNDDSGFFSIDSSTGAVTLTANPDYESKSSYAFTVVATDSAGNTSEQPVTLKVNDLDDTAPPAPSTPVLTPASDSGRSDTDNLTNNRTPSFTGTAEANSSIELFAGNTSLGSTKTDSSGNWSFTVPESAPLTDGSFAITALATDSAGNTSLRSADLNITIDATTPTFTSGGSAAAINENSGSNQLIYTATATDTSPLNYSLKTNNNDDSGFFSIDSSTGAVTLTANPDYESKSSYAFTVVATDSAGNTSEQPVTLKVNDLANEASYQYSGFNSSFDFISQSSPAAQIGPKDYATAFELENRFKSSLSNSILITFEADNGWLDVNGAYPDSFTPDDHQLLAGSSSPYSSFSPAAPGTNARTTLVPATSAGQHANGSAQGTIEYIHADTSQNSGRRVHFNLSNVGHVAGVDEPDLARLNQYSNIDRGVNVTSGNDLVTNSEYDQFLEILPSEQTEGGLNVYFTGTKAGSGDSFSNPVNAFGFYLMGREDKRDVYLDVYDIAGNLIHSAPTKEPDNPSEAVVEYITFTLDSDSNNSPIASFSLREEWKNGNGPSQRDIFSIDNLSLEFASGNNQSTDPLNPTNSSNNIKLSASHLNARGSQSISIPIVISDAAGIESLDLNLTYDTSIFDQPTTRPLITAGSLNSGSSFVINNNPPGQVAISWAGTSPLPAGSGSIATLNLEVKADASVGSSLIDLVSASINENAISTSLVDGSITLLPPSFQIIATRQLPNGLALQLPEAPDLDALNLYDGPDTAIDTPDLLLSDADGKPIALSAHWQEDSKELFLLANEPFTAGDYNLSIDSRADGLISASSGELLDGDGDGKAGDALSTSISFSAPEHSLSIADTARGAGQSLSPNGRNTHDPVTGAPLETSRGLPIHLSTSSSLTAFSGQISYDSSLLHNNQLDSALTTGSDLPADWTLQINPSSTPGKLNYSASGSTPITGNNQQILRFHATVATNAAPPANATTGNGLYGSSTLINASFSSDQITGQPIAIDPGLIALAYAGDTTGDGTLSSLDALHVQRVVVRLDSGFDAYDKLNPVLIGDTTGNGTLSSLDASRIQQKVVELPVDTFPGIPQQ